MLKIIRKADIVLFILLVLLGLGLSLPALVNAFAAGESAGAVVEISVAGEVRERFPLDSNREILIVQDGDQVTIESISDSNSGHLGRNYGHLNKVIIKDSTVQMSEADCHNQLCVKQGTITKAGQAIVCLPNRVVIRILGERDSSEGGDADVISG